MFYSEAILSKKGPLARVWLAAHWERKLSKTQFLQTNIQSSVGAILKQDQQPMALRLSGQLLLGVVRIYSRKAKYLLEDCTEALNKIKLAFRQGEVDIPEDQRIANFESITLPDNITEFDILLPDSSQKQWDDVVPVNTTSSNISRPQDITIRDNFDNSLNLNIGEDLLGEAFDTEDGRGLELDLEDDLDPKMIGLDGKSDSHAGDEGSLDIEMVRDAQRDISLTMDDIIGGNKNNMEDDPLMMLDDGGPDLDLLEETLDEQMVNNNNNIELLDNDIQMLDHNDNIQVTEVTEENQERRIEIESGLSPKNLDTNINIDMDVDPTELILNETRVQEEMLPDTQRLTPMSPLSPEHHEDLFRNQEIDQPITQTRRKRKLMLDELTELPNRHIANQIKDTSDITMEPTYLPSSRKLLRIGEIRKMGASYYFDLEVPHNILPEFQHLFARKRQRFTPPPEEHEQERIEAGPSRSVHLENHFEIVNDDNLNGLDIIETNDNLTADKADSTQNIERNEEVNQENISDKADKGQSPKNPDADKEKEGGEKIIQDDIPVHEQEQIIQTTPEERTSEYYIDIDNNLDNNFDNNNFDNNNFDNNFDTMSHHESGDAEAITPVDYEDSPSPQGITIFDQEQEDQQQNTETTFSKNTIKAMKLLRSKCREEINEHITESDIPKSRVVSYDQVVGTAKRQDAVKLFFELLVLNTKDVIHVQQKQPYGDIQILCKDKLFDLLEDVPS
ncbi:hypothetical protein Glove_158g52 [Diversispora epigaea]|uniref:Rad21/Rec8-like protein N-terminal domain-containing protein n=1 Tax=Diversispora epigaea TaxID=1348612 RepID=A0A397J0I8_9GLOM|nr:hypothetical protein Glove_158g52 [Diversispora epigaea]